MGRQNNYGHGIDCIHAGIKKYSLDIPRLVSISVLEYSEACYEQRAFNNCPVKDNIFFLSVKLASVIHDSEYSISYSTLEKRKADKRYKRNMLTIINQMTGSYWLRVLRRHYALNNYSLAVKFGMDYFKSKSKGF